MRTAFARTLLEVARADPRIWLLTGDLGFSVLEPFQSELPNRFVNVGVAEQNLAGIAAGIAHSGNCVFIYSIANFPTFRCLEQIRNDICHPGLDVRIVSVGGGLSYGPAGYTHHGLEDIAILRALPGMMVVAPGDPVEAELATRALTRQRGPAYLRLGKAGEPQVHAAPPAFELGRAIVLRRGTDLTLVATGSSLKSTLEAADELQRLDGLSAGVISMHTIKPLDADTLLEAARSTPWIISVEEHSEIGGLGSAIADALGTRSGHRLARIALPDRRSDEIGSQAYLLSRFGSIRDRVRGALESAPT